MLGSILITGGFGYLGGRIATILHNTGHNVTLGTRFPRTHAPSWLPAAKTLQMNYDDADFLVKQLEGFDYVIHLAAMNAVECFESPGSALIVNGAYTSNLLNASIHNNVKRFIYFSTVHVYGSPLRGVISEQTIPQPMHPYSISHKVAEDFVYAAHSGGKITGIILRLTNGYGCPVSAGVQCWNLLVNDVARQLTLTGKVRLKSDGSQLRDFIPIANVAEAVNHLLKFPINNIRNGIFNLGSGRTTTIRQMSELVASRWEAILDQRTEIQAETGNNEPVADMRVSIEKLRNTGFCPSNAIIDEIDATIRFCISNKTFLRP